MKNRHKVFISTTSFGQEEASVLGTLKKAGIECTLNSYHRRLSEKEIKDILSQGQYQGLLAGLEPLTRNVLSKAAGLKVISRVGVGLDNIDQSAARQLGIKVFNTPGVLTDSVAELTLGFILSALRKISFLDRKMHAGSWEKQMGSLLKGKTVGIIGMGNIGQRVADLVMAFEAQVIFTDIIKVKKEGTRQTTLVDVLKKSDVISIHSAANECLIGPQAIELLKPGVILVNTARGALIDEKALCKAIELGKIAGVALDVFEEEPYHGPLCKNDQAILTPHIGSYAREARMMMESMAVDNLIKGLKSIKSKTGKR